MFLRALHHVSMSVNCSELHSSDGSRAFGWIRTSSATWVEFRTESGRQRRGTNVTVFLVRPLGTRVQYAFKSRDVVEINELKPTTVPRVCIAGQGSLLCYVFVTPNCRWRRLVEGLISRSFPDVICPPLHRSSARPVSSRLRTSIEVYLPLLLRLRLRTW